MRLLGVGRSALRRNRILSGWPPIGTALKRRSIHPRSQGCQAADSKRFVQKALAPEFETDVKAVEAEHQICGFGQGLAIQSQSLKPIPVQCQRLLESTERSQMNRQGRRTHFKCVLSTQHTPIGHQEPGPLAGRTATPDTSAQLGAKSERIQRPELKQHPEPKIGVCRLKHFQGGPGEVKQSARI